MKLRVCSFYRFHNKGFLKHQQNFIKYTITVFVLSAKINSYEELTKLTPEVKEHLNQDILPTGAIIIKAG